MFQVHLSPTARQAIPISLLTECHNVVVSFEVREEPRSQAQPDPQLVPILEVEPNASRGNERIDLHSHTLLEVATNTSKRDSAHERNIDAYRDIEADRLGVDSAFDLRDANN